MAGGPREEEKCGGVEPLTLKSIVSWLRVRGGGGGQLDGRRLGSHDSQKQEMSNVFRQHLQRYRPLVCLCLIIARLRVKLSAKMVGRGSI